MVYQITHDVLSPQIYHYEKGETTGVKLVHPC